MEKLFIHSRPKNLALQSKDNQRPLSINHNRPRPLGRGSCRLITKKNLGILIEDLKKGCAEFIAPKKEHADDIIFGDARNDAEVLLDYLGNSVISPRAFFLPHTELLFEIRSAKNGDFIPIEDKKKRIFYGIRPCDIKALVMMRKFFLDDTFGDAQTPPFGAGEEYVAFSINPETDHGFQPGDSRRVEFADEFYRQKLEASTIIALACTRPCADNSFCNLMDAGPVAKDGFDLQLIPVSAGYLVEVGSKKGAGIINKHKELFSRAKPQAAREIRKSLNNFAEKVKKLDFRKLARIIQEDKVNTGIWDDVGLRCVVCSGCISLCPTCSCFSIADRVNKDKGVRLRYYDGCPYAGFTRMAGNNTPYPLHKEHIRRFFEHKLSLDVQRYGYPSCVGCARCIQACPGNISIKKFIERIMGNA